MKVLLVFSLLLVYINAATDIAEQNILPHICFKPFGGPVCQKISTYYWSMFERKCKKSKYLAQPCGFFYDKDRCQTICNKRSWSLSEAEEYIKTIQ